MKALGASVLLAAAALCCAGPVLAQDLLIRRAKVYTVSSQGVIDDGEVLVRAGKVAAVGRGLTAPSGATIIDAQGHALTPGIFAGLSQVGLKEVSAESSTVDGQLDMQAPAWDAQWRPEFDVTQAYNPRSTLVPVARIEGLTWTVLTPGGASVIAGQGAAITLDGRYDAVLKGTHALFVQLGSAGGEISGGSRAAQYMLLDQAVREASERGPMGPKALLHPQGRTVLAHYLAGGRVVFRVERAADILQALAFAGKQRLQPLIWGGSEAWLVAEALARQRASVILNPLQDLPTAFDRLASRIDNAALLQRAGVRIAFSSDDSHNARAIRQLAGNAVAHGLPWDAALAAITANPAEIFGLGAGYGRIAVGNAADLVLWDGDDPLEVTTIAARVWIAGRMIAMRSRQTQLRDRYLER